MLSTRLTQLPSVLESERTLPGGPRPLPLAALRHIVDPLVDSLLPLNSHRVPEQSQRSIAISVALVVLEVRRLVALTYRARVLGTS